MNEYSRCRFHVPPGKVGPMSRILNQTSPEPSNAAAVVGALAMYTEIGPWWYTVISAVKDTEDPAATETVAVLAPLAPPSLHLRSFEARSNEVRIERRG